VCGPMGCHKRRERQIFLELQEPRICGNWTPAIFCLEKEFKITLHIYSCENVSAREETGHGV
jgi:hypothetical protein